MTIENDQLDNEGIDHAQDTANPPAGDGSQAGEGAQAPTQEEQRDADLDAFQKGVDSLKDEPDAATKETKDGDAAGKPAADASGPGAKKPDPGAPVDPKGDAGKKQPDPELEKEISGLALKGKAAERFREMAGEIKTTRPMMETLKGLNVTSQEQLNGILKDASAGLQWEKAVMDSTAQPEQLTSALQVIKAMNTSDPKLHRMALDAMLGECKNVAERLGVEIPGLTGDILDKHPDLKQAVDAMDITRERAVELAQLRAGNKNYESRDQQQAEQGRQRQMAEQAERAEMARIDDLSNTLQRNDPQFQAKFAALQANGTFAAIGNLPVQQRYAAVLQAYNALQIQDAPPATAAPARVRPSAITHRGNNVSGNGVARTEFKNDYDAFEAGVESVTHRG